MAKRPTYKTVGDVGIGFDNEHLWLYQESGYVRDKGSCELSREQVASVGEYILRGLLARTAVFDVKPIAVNFRGGRLTFKTGRPLGDTGRRHLPAIGRADVPRIIKIFADFLAKSSS